MGHPYSYNRTRGSRSTVAKKYISCSKIENNEIVIRILKNKCLMTVRDIVEKRYLTYCIRKKDREKERKSSYLNLRLTECLSHMIWNHLDVSYSQSWNRIHKSTTIHLPVPSVDFQLQGFCRCNQHDNWLRPRLPKGYQFPLNRPRQKTTHESLNPVCLQGMELHHCQSLSDNHYRRSAAKPSNRQQPDDCKPANRWIFRWQSFI